MERRKVAYISGHLDVTLDEFRAHYCQPILDAIRAGHQFVVGDARGADDWANKFLWTFCNDLADITVYHMLDAPRYNAGELQTMGGFTSDDERDTAMTAASDYDIAWVRKGREKSGTATNIARRLNGKLD